MIRKIVLIAILLLLFVPFLGCKKETDTQVPVIVLNSPTENQPYNVFEEIAVTGTVYDNQQLTYVRIQLLDEQMTPVLPPVLLEPEENNYTLNQAYALDDVLLKTGHYYLQVQAHDGIQATNKYVALQITAAPKQLSFIVAVTKSGSQLSVVKIDSAFQTTTLFTVNSDYLGSGVYNDHGLFYLGGSYSGDITVYDMSIWQQEWNVPVTISPPSAWFTGMMVSGGYLWVGYRNGKYEKYDYYGNNKMAINTLTGWAPRKFCLVGNKLVVEEKSNTGPETELTVRFEFSGAIDGDYYITENTVDMIPIDETNLCHITNTTTGQAHLYLFNTDILDEEEPSSTLGTGKAYCAVPVGSNIIIGHDQGVYWFSPDHLTTTLWLSGVSARALFRDETQGWIVAGQGNQLKIFLDNFPSVTTVQTVTLSDSIVAVHGVYNKD